MLLYDLYLTSPITRRHEPISVGLGLFHEDGRDVLKIVDARHDEYPNLRPTPDEIAAIHAWIKTEKAWIFRCLRNQMKPENHELRGRMVPSEVRSDRPLKPLPGTFPEGLE